MTADAASSVTAFYQSVGQRLVDPEHYPPEIQEHLVAEEDLLLRLIEAGNYSAVVEVGCMHGCLHFSALARVGVRYLGIDIVAESIHTFQETLRKDDLEVLTAEAMVLDVCELESVKTKFVDHRVLALFPFNSFGNLDDPVAAIREVAKCGFDALILTYHTDPKSTASRADYYGRCGYAAIEVEDREQGVCFSSNEGLRTWAYRRGWLAAQLHAVSYGCTEHDVGTVGVGYWCRPSGEDA